jgi:hypothetical protein
VHALKRLFPGLPVMFTVRTKGQCGAFPDDPWALARALRVGLRAGVEWLDVEVRPMDDMCSFCTLSFFFYFVSSSFFNVRFSFFSFSSCYFHTFFVHGKRTCTHMFM